MEELKLSLEVPAMKIEDYPPPRIPDEIDLECCRYTKIVCGIPKYYTSKETGKTFTDDQFFKMLLDNENRLNKYIWNSTSYFLEIPITHKCYRQAVDIHVNHVRDNIRHIEFLKGADITPDYKYPSMRVVKNNKLDVYVIRVWWLHSPAPEGADWGSNAYSVEKARRDRDSCEDRLLER